MNETYQAGDVLFVLDEEQHRIIPVQVFSVTVRKTLRGEEQFYEVVTPAKPDRPVSLEKIKSPIYSSLDVLHQELLSNAQTAIGKMVSHAAAVTQKAFSVDVVDSDPLDPIAAEPDTLQAEAPQTPKPVINGSTITLPDGTKQRIDLPAVALLEKPVLPESVQKAAAAG